MGIEQYLELLQQENRLLARGQADRARGLCVARRDVQLDVDPVRANALEVMSLRRAVDENAQLWRAVEHGLHTARSIIRMRRSLGYAYDGGPLSVQDRNSTRHL